MSTPVIKYCPGTLAEGHDTYSKTCLKRMFNGAKVSHILSYGSPAPGGPPDKMFIQNQIRVSNTKRPAFFMHFSFDAI